MDSFRLCAFADEAGAEISEQISALTYNNIGHLEVRGVGSKNISKLSLSEAEDLKKTLDSSNIKVWSIGSPIGKIDINEGFKEHFELFRHIVEIAKILDAKCIRIFSFFMPKNEDPSIYKDLVLSRLSQFCDYVKDMDIVLCHENEKGIYGDVATRCLEIHENLPQLKAVFDPANFVQCEENTLAAWEMLSPFVYYMHIKDAHYKGKIVPAGKGDGNIPEILEKFKLQGGSVLTLEPHLAVFKGLSDLEKGHSSIVDENVYSTKREAFDAAVTALRAII